MNYVKITAKVFYKNSVHSGDIKISQQITVAQLFENNKRASAFVVKSLHDVHRCYF